MHTFCALSINGLSLVSDYKLFSPDHIFQFYRHHARLLQQSVSLMPWPFLLAVSLFLPPNVLSQVSCFLQERFLYSSETYFALLHIIISNFFYDDFIIFYDRSGLNLVYRRCGLNLSYLTPGI